MTITLAISSDINAIIQLIQKRIEWMNKEGIEQWNKSDYLKTFTLEYFDKVLENKNLYKVCDTNNVLVGAFTLFEDDVRWTDSTPALYIHNFVSQIGTSGVGDAIISFCEEEARQRGIENLRIDCQKTNIKLNEYYQIRGFEYINSFDEDLYSGNRREKTLTQ